MALCESVVACKPPQIVVVIVAVAVTAILKISFKVQSSWKSNVCESSPVAVSLEQCQVAADRQSKPPTYLTVNRPVGCYLLHPPSPSCSFSYHTWQFIIFTIFTITACIYSLRISFWTQDLALQQILSSIDLFLFYRTGYTDSRTMLNGCTCKCVRLSRPLVGFWTHFKSLHFHFISFHFNTSTSYHYQQIGCFQSHEQITGQDNARNAEKWGLAYFSWNSIILFSFR